jgi:hypothetical protein
MQQMARIAPGGHRARKVSAGEAGMSERKDSVKATTLSQVMGLQSFERSLERMVEGVFSRGSHSSIRPVELGRRLLREMDDNRSVDVKGRRIVPNDFSFQLSGKDHAGFSEIDEALNNELCETAREYARAEGFHFMGPVRVAMTVDNNLKPGRFTVTSRLRESGSGGGPATLVLPSGERVTLGDRIVTIGRLPDCTIALPDANVSRKHTEVHHRGNAFVIVDLGSTNGTKINGTRIDGERTLADGDIVSVGSTHLRFEAT